MKNLKLPKNLLFPKIMMRTHRKLFWHPCQNINAKFLKIFGFKSENDEKYSFFQENLKLFHFTRKKQFLQPCWSFYCRKVEDFLLQVLLWSEVFKSFEANYFQKNFLGTCRRQFTQRCWTISCQNAKRIAKISININNYNIFPKKITFKKLHWTQKFILKTTLPNFFRRKSKKFSPAVWKK